MKRILSILLVLLLAFTTLVGCGLTKCAHDYDSVVTNPTCTATGITTKTCKLCGDVQTSDELAALGHDYVNGVCSRCDAADPDYVAPHEHTFVDGKCECGADDPNYVPHEHTFVNGKCECGADDPNYVAPHEHTFVNGKCECGADDPNYVPHEHTFVDGKCECGADDPNYVPHEHTFVNGKCECGADDPNYVAPHEHTFVNGKCECGADDPNYVPHEHTFVDGKCECGADDPNYVPHEHTFVNGKCECGTRDPNYVDPNAPVVGKGYIISAYNVNSVLYFAGDVASGRFTSTANAEDATVVYIAVGTNAGEYIIYFVVDNANKYIVMADKAAGGSFTANAAEATPFVWDSDLKTYVAADPDNARAFGMQDTSEHTTFSCYAISNTTGYNWGQFAEAPTPCEHVWNDGVVTEPTCATAGYTTFTCTLCETTKVENEVAATGEHVWNDGVVTEPNCGAAGYTTFTCTLCETTKVENEVAANGNHVWNDGVVTEPTCGAAGYTTFTCTLCETTKVENEVAATGNHSYTDGVCSVCGGNDPDYVDPNAPVVGTAYHFGMINTNKDNNVYYIKGGMVDYYFATSSDVAEALEVYLESTDGGYYLYVIDNGNKLYINFVVVTGSDNKLHTNSKYEETASTVFVYNSVLKTVETDIDGEIYILGTRNDKSYTTVGPVKASSNPFYCEFYAITEGGEDPVDPQPPVEEPGEDPVDPQPPVEEPGEDPVDPQPPVDEPTGEEIVFDLGENGTAHNDGTEIKDGTITFTSNGYELVLTDLSKVFSGAFDAKGNSVLKLGASSVTGSFEFTVPNDVVSVEIYIAKYKSNTTKIQINDGTAESLTKNSNDGEYDVITVDTTTNKTVKVSTVSGGVRAMVNTIVFITGEAPAPCEHEWNEGEVTAPTCGAVGYTTYTCTLCESTKVEDEVAATGEHVWDEGVVTAPTCGAAGYTTFTCTLCESTKKDNEVPATDDHSYDIVVVAPTCTKGGYTTYTCECGDTYVADELDALGHSYTDGVCTVCGANENGTLVVNYVLKATDASGNAYYWNGTASGGKGGITTDSAEAAVLTLEVVDGGVYVYFTDATGTKNYITIKDDNKGLGTSKDAVVLQYDEENGYIYSGDRYIATYGVKDVRTYKASNIPGKDDNMYMILTAVA